MPKSRGTSRPLTESSLDPNIAQFWNPLTAAGRAALDAMITQQAQIIAYIDDYKLLMIATIVVIPLLVVFKRESGGRRGSHGSDGINDRGSMARHRNREGVVTPARDL